jgi:hypothetical protein
MAITVSFPISVLMHSSLVMQWLSQKSASNFGHRRRCHGWSANLGRVTNVLFTPFKTTDPASNWANINDIFTIHASQTFIGLEPSAVMNSVTSLCLICTPTTSTILHCYCFDRTWLPGAPMILMELDSFTIWWARQEVLPNTKIGGITFVPTFIHTRFHQIFFWICLEEMCNQTQPALFFFTLWMSCKEHIKMCIKNFKIVIFCFVLVKLLNKECQR